MTLEEQLAYFDKHKSQALARSCRDYKNLKELVLAEARSRLVEGFATYGDASWSKTYTELRQDELEELADAVVYRVIRMSRGWPT